MNLYRWSSDALKQYGSGNIFAAAASVEEARAKVEAAAGYWYAADRIWQTDWMLQITHEDDAEEYRRWRAMLAIDLAKEPEIMTSGVGFVSGSE